MKELRRIPAFVMSMLCSLIADSVSFALLLTAGLIELLYDGKSLTNVIDWRTKLEQALEHGTNVVHDEWPKHGLSYPIGMQLIEDELKKVKEQETSLRLRKKTVIVVLLVLGAFFWFFARYLSGLGL
jgi:hypothetical protein